MRVEFLKTERVGCNECAGIVIFGLFYAFLRLDVLLCISPGSVWFAAANADRFANCGVWVVFGSFFAVVAPRLGRKSGDHWRLVAGMADLFCTIPAAVRGGVLIFKASLAETVDCRCSPAGAGYFRVWLESSPTSGGSAL